MKQAIAVLLVLASITFFAKAATTPSFCPFSSEPQLNASDVVMGMPSPNTINIALAKDYLIAYEGYYSIYSGIASFNSFWVFKYPTIAYVFNLTYPVTDYYLNKIVANQQDNTIAIAWTLTNNVPTGSLRPCPFTQSSSCVVTKNSNNYDTYITRANIETRANMWTRFACSHTNYRSIDIGFDSINPTLYAITPNSVLMLDYSTRKRYSQQLQLAFLMLKDKIII